MKRKTLLSVALCSFAVSAANGRVLIVPDGHIQTRDARKLSLFLSPENGRAIALASVQSSSPFIVDYEHQTLLSEINGQPAPLSGQGDHLEYVEGEGLYAVDFKWTKRALKYLEGGEYGFISPVVLHTKAGEITKVAHAALTNFQAIDEMPNLSRLAAKYQTNQPSGENEMNEAQLKLLGLKKDADDAAVLAALTALVKKASDSEDEVGVLKATLEADADGKPDLSKYVPIAVVDDLKKEVAALSGKIQGDEADSLITAALSDGRLLPAQKDWAEELGKSDLAALKQYVDTAQPIAALKGTQTGGKGPAVDGEGQLTGTAADVASAFGNSAEDLKKYG